MGGLTFLGSLLGKDEPEKKDDPLLWKACQEFYNRFEKEVAGGSVNCRDMIGVDWSDRDQAVAFYKSDKVVLCRENTGKAALILGELMEKYLDEKGEKKNLEK